jgi:hypothetical protein
VKLQSFSLVVVAALAGASASCGQYVRDQGRSPSQLVIESLIGIPGDAPSQKSNTMISDVETLITEPSPQCTKDDPCRTWLNDQGEAKFSLVLKDPGSPGTDTSPSALNSVTLTQYHVEFKRSDGRNAQGIDVPYAFDSAVTVTVPASGTATVDFDLVRHDAKKESPLISLICSATCPPMISTIAEVTFYGRDQAGNNVSVKGSLGVTFGDIVRSE